MHLSKDWDFQSTLGSHTGVVVLVAKNARPALSECVHVNVLPPCPLVKRITTAAMSKHLRACAAAFLGCVSTFPKLSGCLVVPEGGCTLANCRC